MKWRLPWPWLIRFSSLAMLAGLALVLWQLVPPQPRCRITWPDNLQFGHLSDDGRKWFLAIEGPDLHLQVWDTFSGKLVQTLTMKKKLLVKQRVPAFAGLWEDENDQYYFASTDDRYLLYWHENQHAIFDLMENRPIPLPMNLSDRFFLSYCGKNFFCLSDDKETLLVEWSSGRIMKQYPLGREVAFFKGQRAPLAAKEEYFLCDNSTNGLVAVDHLPSGRRILELQRKEGWYFFSPEGSFLIFLGLEKPGVLRAWHLPTGKETVAWSGVLKPWVEDDVNDLFRPEFNGVFYISPDDRFFVCRKEGNAVELGDLATGEKLSSLVNVEASLGPFNHCRFSPNNPALALAGGEGKPLMLFEVPSGRQLWQQPWPSFGQDMVFRDNSLELMVLRVQAGMPAGVTTFETLSGQLRLEWRGVINLKDQKREPKGFMIIPEIPDGSWLQKVREWLGLPTPVCLEIIDPWTGRSQGKVEGVNDFGLLSSDGRSLVILDEPGKSWMFYDVPLRPPLVWTLGPPLVLGLLMLGFGYWRQKRRRCFVGG